MKDYKNLAEIDKDLQVLQLKRKIALEELKYVKRSTIDNFHPYEWLRIYFLKKITTVGFDFLFRKSTKKTS